MNKTKLDDLFPMEEYECVSINKEYLIINGQAAIVFRHFIYIRFVLQNYS